MSGQQPLDDWIYDLSKPGRALSREDVQLLADAIRVREATRRQTLPQWLTEILGGAATYDLATLELTWQEAVLFAVADARDWARKGHDAATQGAARSAFLDLFFEERFGPEGYRSPAHQRVVAGFGPTAPTSRPQLPGGANHASDD